jgi:xanthine dehydrogenase YagT iron-sulfur-binding subunit
MSQQTFKGVSRRGFLKGSGAAVAASAVVSTTTADGAEPGLQVVSGETSITLNVNGKPMTAAVEPRTTLLDVLRYQFDLTGAKPQPFEGENLLSDIGI